MAIPALFAKRTPAPATISAVPDVIVSDSASVQAAAAPVPPKEYIASPTDVVVRYAPAAVTQSGAMGTTPSRPVGGPEQGRYHLLEIGADLEKEIERLGRDGERVSLTIKGRPSDDAVLCTQSRTYALRSITVSNSLLVMQPPSAPAPSSLVDDSDVGDKRGGPSLAGSDAKRRRTRSTSPLAGSSAPPRTLELRATSHEILEAQPCPPRLERIGALLRPSAWEGLDARPATAEVDGTSVPRGPGKRWTKRKLESVIQASDEELDQGLRNRKVIEWEGDLLLLPPVHLVPLLSILLNLVTLHGDALDSVQTATLTPEAKSYRCPVAPVETSLHSSHDLPGGFAHAVLALFGAVEHGSAGEGEDWLCDVRSVVRAVGEGLLWRVREKGSGASMRCGTFLDEWREEVGAGWADLVGLELLEGEYLLQPPSASTSVSADTRTHTLLPFPSSLLPTDPPTLFTELFLTRPRWRPHEMRPFLRGLVPDAAGGGGGGGKAAAATSKDKALDKLVVKYVRVSKEGKGGAEVTWWYPRRT